MNVPSENEKQMTFQSFCAAMMAGVSVMTAYRNESWLALMIGVVNVWVMILARET